MLGGMVARTDSLRKHVPSQIPREQYDEINEVLICQEATERLCANNNTIQVVMRDETIRYYSLFMRCTE